MSHVAELVRDFEDTERELRGICTSYCQGMCRNPEARHDLRNALMLVTCFRDLIDETSPADLLADAASAVERARSLGRCAELALAATGP